MSQNLQEPDNFKSVADLDELANKFKFNSDGLIPAIAQDFESKQVLMLAYMNLESIELTLKTKKVHYWSRSRQELWLKGATSGHFQSLKSFSLDCDSDTILLEVEQIGPACHTGTRSCFDNRELFKAEEIS